MMYSKTKIPAPVYIFSYAWNAFGGFGPRIGIPATVKQRGGLYVSGSGLKDNNRHT